MNWYTNKQTLEEVKTKLTACMDDVIVAITNIVVNTTMALSVKFSISK